MSVHCTDETLFMTFVDDGGHVVGRYVLDNLNEAKKTVEEYLNMKYAVDVGEWAEDDWGDRHILQTSPDNFNAGVAPLSLHSTADEALGPMRESWEAEKELVTDGGVTHENEVPQCPAEDCENNEFEKNTRFGNLSCTECGHMPRFPLRDDIREAMGMETVRR